MILIDRAVLTYVSKHPGCARSEIRREVAPEASTSTVWRALRRLVDAGKLEVVGEGRGTRYRVAGGEAVLAHLKTPTGRRRATAASSPDATGPTSRATSRTRIAQSS